ncbi:MAG: CBS domain-containing protein [Verrucomicrobia subdivision 3 bacterium]|nr:CBS domain-containing protein [Limisphaerales bacterium]
MNAKTILEDKSTGVRSIEPDATVFEAVRLMDEFKVGALMVVDEGQLVGIISERDYTRKVVLKDRSSKSTQVSEIMTRDLVQISPDASLEECMAVMGQNRVRHLPVTEAGKILGVITSTDLLILSLNQKDHIIQQLEQYIAPGP